MHIKFMYLVLHREKLDNVRFAHCIAQPPFVAEI